MRAYLSVVTTALLVAACGGDNRGSESAGAPAADGPAAAGPAVAGAPAAPGRPDAAVGQASVAPPASGPALGGRTGELVNPDNNTMIFLYYDLAGLTPPIDNWVANDNRVKLGQPIDKASLRTTVRAELEAGAAAVRGIGYIRLSLNSANLSDYDPTYSEFTVRALAPSSVVDFTALDQKVSLKFANGRTAQIWRVPPDEAQLIRDKIGYSGNVELDAYLKITAVQPGPGGGTITTEILEYEMRQTQTGATIARVQLAQP